MKVKTKTIYVNKELEKRINEKDKAAAKAHKAKKKSEKKYPTLTELSNTLAEDITKISGINEELLGSATDDKSGVLSMLRQGAGLTTLQMSNKK